MHSLTGSSHWRSVDESVEIIHQRAVSQVLLSDVGGICELSALAHIFARHLHFRSSFTEDHEKRSIECELKYERPQINCDVWYDLVQHLINTLSHIFKIMKSVRTEKRSLRECFHAEYFCVMTLLPSKSRNCGILKSRLKSVS